ncbi:MULTISPECIES: zinc metallopeptidase [Shouchella]|uniref:Membrane zinc-dependent metallopeptidase n=4 Tax=Bacillaceae TaxID=186817 RepID=A0A060M234_9BACI|nr:MULTISPECIES: zinc metallopeptidase [Bacillaceae]RQW20458.1 zinc metallopeptidase [Bacillus sp. C1-1]GAF24204.1 metal-dependent peptidase [Bacillus sp. JCM 19047]AIC94588.1 membrane zinc-dependent metallopeptidase [Shouchella lehensis G1]KQL51852.1 Zn-dependent protease [Alkalicoccobacillus plakortidis]MED4127053.1 zinc metallopeptidase [Shouchella miscanthi]
MSLGGYLIYLALLLIIPMIAQGKVKSAYNKYSQIRNSSGMTGAEVARKILNDNGLHDVAIEETKGELSDHYDPKAKTVRLSTNNYHKPSVAAAAIAAHEVGHAIQDAEEYAFLKFRSALVPAAQLGTSLGQWLIMIGLLITLFGSASPTILLAGIVMFSAAVLFQIVTLPVEFNASNQAMAQMVSSGIIRNDEERETKKVLNAAAMTYVAAALVAVMELARLILIYLAQRD